MLRNNLINLDINDGAEFISWFNKELRPESELLTQNHIDIISEIVYAVTTRPKLFEQSQFNPEFSKTVNVLDIVTKFKKLGESFRPVGMTEQELTEWYKTQEMLLATLKKVDYQTYNDIVNGIQVEYEKIGLQVKFPDHPNNPKKEPEPKEPKKKNESD